MIIDTGGLLIVLLVIAVPVAVYVVQRGKRSRTNNLLARIAELQGELAGSPDPMSEIRSASSEAELDRAVRRAQARSEIASLTARLPPDLRDRAGRGA